MPPKWGNKIKIRVRNTDLITVKFKSSNNFDDLDPSETQEKNTSAYHCPYSKYSS